MFKPLIAVSRPVRDRYIQRDLGKYFWQYFDNFWAILSNNPRQCLLLVILSIFCTERQKGTCGSTSSELDSSVLDQASSNSPIASHFLLLYWVVLIVSLISVFSQLHPQRKRKTSPQNHRPCFTIASSQLTHFSVKWSKVKKTAPPLLLVVRLFKTWASRWWPSTSTPLAFVHWISLFPQVWPSCMNLLAYHALR